MIKLPFWNYGGKKRFFACARSRPISVVVRTAKRTKYIARAENDDILLTRPTSESWFCRYKKKKCRKNRDPLAPGPRGTVVEMLPSHADHMCVYAVSEVIVRSSLFWWEQIGTIYEYCTYDSVCNVVQNACRIISIVMILYRDDEWFCRAVQLVRWTRHGCRSPTLLQWFVCPGNGKSNNHAYSDLQLAWKNKRKTKNVSTSVE